MKKQEVLCLNSKTAKEALEQLLTDPALDFEWYEYNQKMNREPAGQSPQAHDCVEAMYPLLGPDNAFWTYCKTCGTNIRKLEE